MALIGTAAYENPVLLEIGSAKSYRLPPTANNPDGVTIKMEHKMLTEGDPNYYQAAIAGKTGFTSIAGQTLVTYASKDDRKLIAVTMKSTEFTHYQDTKALLDFGFDRFKNSKLLRMRPPIQQGISRWSWGTVPMSRPTFQLTLKQ